MHQAYTGYHISSNQYLTNLLYTYRRVFFLEQLLLGRNLDGDPRSFWGTESLRYRPFVICIQINCIIGTYLHSAKWYLSDMLKTKISRNVHRNKKSMYSVGMSKKSWPISYIDFQYEMGQDLKKQLSHISAHFIYASIVLCVQEVLTI